MLFLEHLVKGVEKGGHEQAFSKCNLLKSYFELFISGESKATSSKFHAFTSKKDSCSGKDGYTR